jgi:hypothetical protein
MRQAVNEVLATLPCRREGAACRRPATFGTAFGNAVEAARLDRLEEPFTLHGCRHHFASWFVMRGGSLPALQRLLGHATLAMTSGTHTWRPTPARRDRQDRASSQRFGFSARISARTCSEARLGSSCRVTAVLLGSKLEPGAGVEPATY